MWQKANTYPKEHEEVLTWSQLGGFELSAFWEDYGWVDSTEFRMMDIQPTHWAALKDIPKPDVEPSNNMPF